MFSAGDVSCALLPARAFASLGSPRQFASAVGTRILVSLLELNVPQASDFSLMNVGEVVTGGLDFGLWLNPGVTIEPMTLSVTVMNYSPAGGSSYVSLVGDPQLGTIPQSRGGSGIKNASVLQQWHGLAVGIARITFTVQTTDGETLIGWAHQSVGIPN